MPQFLFSSIFYFGSIINKTAAGVSEKRNPENIMGHQKDLEKVEVLKIDVMNSHCGVKPWPHYPHQALQYY